jgi:ankyrin repeat protein
MDKIAFFQAAGKNDVAALTRMLDAGEDPNCIAEGCGHTPLYNACFGDSADAVDLLLQRGADPNKRFDYHSFIDGRVERGLSAIMIAQSTKVARALINAGVDVNIDDAGGRTPLMRAAFRGHPEVVSVLLAAGASPTAQKADGQSAIDIVKERIEFFRQHSSDFREGHADKRIHQFEETYRILQETNNR